MSFGLFLSEQSLFKDLLAFILYLYIYVYECFASLCAWAPQRPERALDSLALKLCMVVSLHMDVEN